MRTEFLLCVCSPVVITVYLVTKDVTKQSADSPRDLSRRLDNPVRERSDGKWLGCRGKAKLDQGVLGRESPEGVSRFTEASRADYDRVKTALTKRFEPPSKRELYNAELQIRTK